MKIRPVGADLFNSDGQTDMTNLIVTFAIFLNAPKNFIYNCTGVTRNTRMPSACA